MSNWDFGRGLHGARFDLSAPRGLVLLLHGYGEHAGRYSHVVEALNAAGFSVFTYDQRGHGRSPGPRALVRMGDLAADHLAAREWLRQHHANLPTFALGHSMGGLVTALSVARDPRGLKGVILSSPALIVGQNEPPLKRALAGLAARVAPNLPVSAVQDGVLSRHEHIGAAFKSDPMCYNGQVKARTAFEMMTGGDKLWSLLGKWELPTLVIHGDADRLITVEGSRRFVREIASADKELWEVAGGYHELFNDLESEAALRKVTDWLGAHLP